MSLRTSRRISAATVRELQETLEAKVAERTAALQAANTELLREPKAKSEFLARVSHDLRQPLNAVVGFTDLLLLQDGEPLSSSQRRYLGHVVTAAQQIVQVDQRPPGSQPAGGRTAGDSSGSRAMWPCCCRKCLHTFGPNPRPAGCRLTLEIASPLGKLMVDQARLQQILHNLVSNAFKFTPDGGLITVTARQIGTDDRAVRA